MLDVVPPNVHRWTRLAGASIALAVLAGCAAPRDSTAWQPGLQPAIAEAMQRYIARGQLPGAVYWLERGHRHMATPIGRHTYEADAPPMQVDTVFDAASLTKVVVTAPAVLQLSEAGRLALDDPLTRHVPECAGQGRDTITLRHLLTHTSGLAASLPSKPPWRGSAAALALACKEQPTHPAGRHFRYSDINFILLGVIVERASGMPLDRYAATHILEPLGMKDTGFRPLQRIDATRIAPTQRTPPNPAGLHEDLPPLQTLQGTAHDPTARFMGGVAGHAGLFTTAADLARFARMVLGDGALGGRRVLSAQSIRQMQAEQTGADTGARRGIGWDIDSVYARRPRGDVFPIGSFGHTGFTGCVLWLDPASRSFYIFLSNRVYPDDQGAILPLYGELATLSALAVGLDRPRH